MVLKFPILHLNTIIRYSSLKTLICLFDIICLQLHLNTNPICVTTLLLHIILLYIAIAVKPVKSTLCENKKCFGFGEIYIFHFFLKLPLIGHYSFNSYQNPNTDKFRWFLFIHKFFICVFFRRFRPKYFCFDAKFLQYKP